MNKEKLKPFISKESSTWLKDAERYERNKWWITPRDYFLIFFYMYKRKLNKLWSQK